jgi:hypothetical protein
VDKFEISRIKGDDNEFLDLMNPWMLICPDGSVYWEHKFEHAIIRMDLVAGSLGSLEAA